MANAFYTLYLNDNWFVNISNLLYYPFNKDYQITLYSAFPKTRVSKTIISPKVSLLNTINTLGLWFYFNQSKSQYFVLKYF